MSRLVYWVVSLPVLSRWASLTTEAVWSEARSGIRGSVVLVVTSNATLFRRGEGKWRLGGGLTAFLHFCRHSLCRWFWRLQGFKRLGGCESPILVGLRKLAPSRQSRFHFIFFFRSRSFAFRSGSAFLASSQHINLQCLYRLSYLYQYLARPKWLEEAILSAG